jgi:hypothetical protein
MGQISPLILLEQRMTEAVVVSDAVTAEEMAELTYSNLVSEVYIEPVRNVVVVDDEFPTLDALIAKQLGEANGWNGEQRDVEAVKDILSFCRSRTRPWLVDVHDGREIDVDGEINIAQHLHHSDLMILDYHLLGDGGTGEKSIRILKQLAKNPHFNLVVVYTKGYQGDIQKVFSEIATALSYSNFSFQSIEEFSKVTELIAEWEIVEENIADSLLQLVSLSDYLRERTSPGAFTRSAAMPRVMKILRSDHCPDGLDPKLVISWIFQTLHETNSKLMSPTDLGNTCSSCAGEVNWIKTNSLFVTVVNKRYKAHELENKLAQALSDFAPPPHQLLMARMRAEIDARGVVAEAAVLDDKYMQAGWLSELFSVNERSRTSAVRATVDRHWEALGDRLRVDIDGFAQRLVDNLHGRGREKIMKRYGGGVHNEVEALLSHVNLYNSTKPVDFTHLRTGQIFELNSDTQSELWICLSPACDLVPGQKNNGWRNSLGGRVPFMAVKLDEMKLSTALDKVQENVNLFVRLDGKVRAFSYCPEGNPLSAPHWEQMFVLNNGEFIRDGSTLQICRISDIEGNIQSCTYDVKVVAQLRNEYAVNLLQKLGGNFSRVGLNFRSRPVN